MARRSGGWRRGLRVTLTGAVLLSVGCSVGRPVVEVGDPSGGGPDARVVAALPRLTSTWERMPDGPLSPRGAVGSFVFDGELFILGGMTYVPDSFHPPPCDSAGPAVTAVAFRADMACTYAAPAGQDAPGAAAVDLTSGRWRTLDVAGVDGASDMTAHAGMAVGFRGDLYDPATGEHLDVPFNEVLVYSDRWWTGERLVEAGCLYRPADADGRTLGLFVAATWAPGDAAWTIHPSPLPETEHGCPESAASVWHDEVLLVTGLGAMCSPTDASCLHAARFDPDAGWESLSGRPPAGRLFVAAGQVMTFDHHALHRVDPSTGRAELVAEVPNTAHPVAAHVATSDGAVVLADRDPATTDLWYALDEDAWYELPAPPDADRPPTDAPVVAFTHDGRLVVWGGHARYSEPSRNSADGFVLVPAGDSGHDDP